MRRLIIFLLFLFISSPPGECYAQVQRQPNRPENTSKPDPYTWDLGRIKRGEVLKRSFNLKNESDRVLNITGINTSCNCTVSEVKNKTLLPGQSTEVAVRFNSRGYSPGQSRQHVYINTDDPDRPVLKFTVKIEVIE